jgi:hypothetical protein
MGAVVFFIQYPKDYFSGEPGMGYLFSFTLEKV